MQPRELVAYITAFTGPLAGNAVLALLGTLQDEWGVSSAAVLLSIPAFMFPFAIGQLFSGTISDAYERRSTLAFGLGVYSIAGFAAAASMSFPFFMACRFVQGIGYAFVSPVLMAMISDLAGPSRQGLSMGYFGMSTSAGVTTGPLLAGFFAQTNWRIAFVLIGFVALTLLVTILVLFRGEGKRNGALTINVLGSQLRSVILDRNVALLSAVGFLAFLSQVGVMSFVSEHLESSEMAPSPFEIGVVLGVSGFLGLVISPISGKLVDVRGARCCAIVGFSLVGGASFLMQFGGEYWEFLSMMSVMGIGTSFMWASLLTMVVRAYPSLKGTSSSVFNSARFAGYAISPLVLAPLYIASGFDAVILSCTLLVFVALLLAMATDRKLSRR